MVKMTKIPYQLVGLQALLNCIQRQDSRKRMCQLLNISNQAISKKLSTLKAKGLIEVIQIRPIGIYKLTALGIQVNQILGQSEHTKQLSGFWKCHNLIVGFDIQDFGSWKFNDKRIKKMKNWHYQEIVLKDHKIHIQSTGLIKIYCPIKYSKSPTEAFDNMIEEAKKIVNYISSKYNLKLGNYRRIRDGQKSLIGSDKIGEILGHMKVGGVWIDASDGTRELETTQDNYDIEKLLAMPDVLDKKLIPVLESLTEQINLHLSVMQDMRETLKAIREGLKKEKE